MTLGICVDSAPIPQVTSHRHLGLVFNETLNWSDHVSKVVLRVSQRIGMLRRIKSRTGSLYVRELYLRAIVPSFEYASIVWSGMSTTDAKRLERCNRAAARVITGISPSDKVSAEILLARAGLQSLSVRQKVAQAKFVFTLLQGKQPDHLCNSLQHWLPDSSSQSGIRKALRDQHLLRLPLPKKNALKTSPLYLSFSTWNTFPLSIRCSPSRDEVTSFFSK